MARWLVLLGFSSTIPLLQMSWPWVKSPRRVPDVTHILLRLLLQRWTGLHDIDVVGQCRMESCLHCVSPLFTGGGFFLKQDTSCKSQVCGMSTMCNMWRTY
mmetsp:Transcript_45010/g.104979  ORF Transcript_45010/g.104979 Transcript_45010/m.104979 type:complete len:101 (+) Transcript_45010:1615-1917(+)